MELIDYLVLLIYFLFLLGMIFWLSRKTNNTEDFFVSGKNTHWVLAGISMVATTFAADTPLAITGIVAKDGISGNWIWWNFALSGMMTVFFFSHLWKRSGVNTDLEFIEIRYSGKAARFLRVFRSVYLSIGVNSIILGWVTIGMGKILSVTMNWPLWITLGGIYFITAFYIVFTGLRGVIFADMVQFVLAMLSSILLAWVSIDHLGGLDSFRQKIMESSFVEKTFFFPWENSLDNWVIWLAMMWWASWYPGAEPGGGGYIAQRMFSVRSEKDSLYATILFNFMHYAIRPWPWIIVAFASFLLMPNLSDPEKGYPLIMMKLLDAPYLGIMMTGFLAAFMSTLSTHLNWASSYLVYDVYKIYNQKKRSESHYLMISRITVFLLMSISFIVSYFFDTVKDAWEFLLALGAGTGPVYLLRWYWWRINAWSEVSAMTIALLVTIFFNIHPLGSLGIQLMITVGLTSSIWVLVTFLTDPVDKEKLEYFYKKIKPGVIGFKGFFRYAGLPIPKYQKEKNSLLDSAILWILSIILIYSTLFAGGYWFFGKMDLFYIALCVIILVIPFFGKRLRMFTRNLDY